MSLGYPHFQASRCTRYRYRYSGCGHCAEACPHQALSLADTGVALDPDRCQHCALCVGACPTGAWMSTAFRPLELLRQAIGQDTFDLACAPSGLPADAYVPCLGALDGVTLAYLAKRAIPVTLHGQAHCAGCAHGRTGPSQLDLHLDAIAVLRDGATAGPNAAGPATDWCLPRLAFAPATATNAFVPARRQWLRKLVGSAEATGGDPLPVTDAVRSPAGAIRAAAHFLPERRELLRLLTRRQDGEPFAVPRHPGLPLLQLRLQSGCHLCAACVRVCPTGALRIEETPVNWALTFQMDHCVACQVCLEVCQPRVLVAEAVCDARPELPPRSLLSQHKQRCSRCDRYFVAPAPEAICPICEDDDAAFTALFG